MGAKRWLSNAKRAGAMRRLRAWRKRTAKAVGTLWRQTRRWGDAPVGFASGLVVVGTIVWLASGGYADWGKAREGVFIEAAGALMDVLVFGVLIGLVVVHRDRRREIMNQQELINDFKKWNSEEARHRIAGAVRRLNRLGKTAIDFVGMETTGFSFRANDISSIAGSKFYAGAWGLGGSQEKAVLQEVEFSFLDCRDVVFSASHPLGGLGANLPRSAQFRDCEFVDANLRGATFKGALLEWTQEPPADVGHWEETQDGEPFWIQDHYGPFFMADLAGTSFEGVAFRNADFRDAENLGKCRFVGATGLEACKFDTEEDKEWATRSAREPAS